MRCRSCWCPARWSSQGQAVHINDDHRNWWSWVPGAQWRHPEDAANTLYTDANGVQDHKRLPRRHRRLRRLGRQGELPSEAQCEIAARGGLEGAVFPWGDDSPRRGAEGWPTPDRASLPGRISCSTARGTFPVSIPAERLRVARLRRERVGVDGRHSVAQTTPNHQPKPCCGPRNPRGTPTSGVGSWRPVSALCDQGRIAPLRAQLLPPLPTGGPAGRVRRHHHQPCRLPLHPEASPSRVTCRVTAKRSRRSLPGHRDADYARPLRPGGQHLPRPPRSICCRLIVPVK